MRKTKRICSLALSSTMALSGIFALNMPFTTVVRAQEVEIEHVDTTSEIKDEVVTENSVTQDFTNDVNPSTSDADQMETPSVEVNNQIIQVDSNSNFVELIANAKAGTIFELTSDIEVTEMVHVQTPNITVKGNGHTITSSKNFVAGNHGQISLFKIQADGVVLENVKLVTTKLNKHVLDVWGSNGVILRNVSLDHTTSKVTGAPLVINGSHVTVEGELTLKTGLKSWYAINIDNKSGNASLNFEKESKINYTGKKPLIVTNKSEAGNSIEILNPENAGLIKGPLGNYVQSVRKITLDKTEAIMKSGEVLELIATLDPVMDDQLTWTSDNENVAIVENGKVTAVADGKAVITVTTSNGKTAQCTVTVARDLTPLEPSTPVVPSTPLEPSIPVEPSTPVDPEINDTSKPDHETPNTGVSNNADTYALFVILSAGLAGSIMLRKRMNG